MDAKHYYHFCCDACVWHFPSSYSKHQIEKQKKNYRGIWRKADKLSAKRRRKCDPAPQSWKISQLKERAEDIRQLNLLLEEQFRMKEAMMHQDGRAKQRQGIMTGDYREKIGEYLSIIDGIPPDGAGSRPPA